MGSLTARVALERNLRVVGPRSHVGERQFRGPGARIPAPEGSFPTATDLPA